jgi:hypothetical protein
MTPSKVIEQQERIKLAERSGDNAPLQPHPAPSNDRLRGDDRFDFPGLVHFPLYVGPALEELY